MLIETAIFVFIFFIVDLKQKIVTNGKSTAALQRDSGFLTIEPEARACHPANIANEWFDISKANY